MIGVWGSSIRRWLCTVEMVGATCSEAWGMSGQ
jgi:hypothetical protein